jgi:hypothetical protein
MEYAPMTPPNPLTIQRIYNIYLRDLRRGLG